MTPTRVAVVGLGGIAEEHLNKLARIEGVEVVGICDLSQTLVDAVGERFGVGPGFTHYAEMLSSAEPQVVHVLSPPATHRDLVLAALERGAHAFVEKPIAQDLAEYEEMRDAAASRGVMLVENYNYLFMDDVQRAVGMVRSGELGEPINLDISMGVGLTGAVYADPEVPHFAHRLPGGAMRNFASHPASIAVALLGDLDKVAVSRRRLSADAIGDDELRALAESERRSAAISITGHSRPFHFDFLLRCTGGTISCDVFSQRLGVAREGSPLTEVGDEVRQGLGWITAAAGRFRRATTTREGYFQGFERLLRDFYAAVEGRGEPPLTSAEIDSTNRLVEALFVEESQL